MLAAIAGCVLFGCRGTAEVPSRFDVRVSLEEESYYGLPAAFRPGGLKAHEDDRFIVWSMSDGRAYFRSPAGWITIDVESRAVGARFMPSGGVSVVDATGRLVHFDERGTAYAGSTPRRLGVPSDSIVSASFLGGDWYVMTTTGGLYRTRPSGSPDRVRESWPELPGAVAFNILLSEAGKDELLLTSTVYPFAAI